MIDRLKQILQRQISKKLNPIKVPSITFIAEQDGVTEQELKRQLKQYFQRELAVLRAYLVLAKYGTADQNVALCIAAESDCHPSIVNSVGEIFRDLFNREMHMDILFLDSRIEQQVQQVAKPFYVQISRKT